MPKSNAHSRPVSELSAEFEDDVLAPETVFWHLAAAWFLLLLISVVAIYFLAPILGISNLMPIALVLMSTTHPAAIFCITMATCLITGCLLASTVLYQPFASHITTNSNLYRWQQIFPQILANAYKNGHYDQKTISIWQIINIIAHMQFIVGGLQLIVNKAFHQLYNQEAVHHTLGFKQQSRNLLTASLLTPPRIMLAPLFVLFVPPLNLLGSLLTELNYAIYRLVWSITDPKSYTETIVSKVWHSAEQLAEARASDNMVDSMVDSNEAGGCATAWTLLPDTVTPKAAIGRTIGRTEGDSDDDTADFESHTGKQNTPWCSRLSRFVASSDRDGVEDEAAEKRDDKVMEQAAAEGLGALLR